VVHLLVSLSDREYSVRSEQEGIVVRLRLCETGPEGVYIQSIHHEVLKRPLLFHIHIHSQHHWSTGPLSPRTGLYYSPRDQLRNTVTLARRTVETSKPDSDSRLERLTVSLK
jgi:hypothetical protein